ncbi:molybdate ABC transporter substrate-binding protein [Nocardioides sp. 1609]|uniref:molybdate ABC transporter substrate-binding protein n=1 Tax=Nocardioides sp. 1609 TaxID=2508327 RepID=UPI001070117D|nr:molybdate ABC transporter substrate-binding protein [Nocardioides sp. 1609]
MRRTALLAAAILLAPALTACGADDEDTTLHVYAAASLTSTFEQVAAVFEEEHDGVDVELSFAGSSDLVSSIREGADADVLASADLATMDEITADGLEAGDPVDFATNTLQIVVPPGNPAGITGFADLAGTDVKLVICAPEVPCGAATRKISENTGVTLSPVSQEQSVADVLGKVTSGEADAGLVYVTDVIAAGDEVEGIELPEAADVVNTYPIVALADSGQDDLAQEFVDLVLGASGQEILAGAGFAPAP